MRKLETSIALFAFGGCPDAGHLRAFVKTIVSLNDASAAYSGEIIHKGGYGKIVIVVN